MVNEQCKNCIHRDVCAYREHLDDAIALYEDAKKEAGKYPYFKMSFDCIKHKTESNIK